MAFFRGRARADLFEKGVIAYRADDYETAEKHFRSILETQPDNTQARRALLVLLIKLERFEEGCSRSGRSGMIQICLSWTLGSRETVMP